MTTSRVPDPSLTRRIAETAVAAARAAGRIQLERFATVLQVDELKRHDVKLEVDKLCEEAAAETIAATFSDHSFLAEEGGGRAGPGEYLWIVDPLDGTVNYFHGIPHYCASVACFRTPEENSTAYAAGKTAAENAASRDWNSLGEPAVGVIYDPAADELYLGVAGAGATVNGKKLRPTSAGKLSEVLVGTSFGSTEANTAHMMKCAKILLPRVRKLRNFGSTALEVVGVARGRLGAHYQRGVHEWDFAAAGIILREAGGIIEAVEYEPGRWELLACAPGIYRPLRKLLP